MMTVAEEATEAATRRDGYLDRRSVARVLASTLGLDLPSAAILSASAGAVIASMVFGGIGALGLAAVVAIAAMGVGVARTVRGTVDRIRTGLEPMALLTVGIAVLGVSHFGIGTSADHSWQAPVAILACVPIARAVIAMYSARLPGRDLDVLVEAALGALGVGIALWLLVAEPLVLGTSLGFAVLLPALDVGLLVLAARLALLPGERIASHRYLVFAFAYMLGAHLSLLLSSLAGLPHASDVPDVLGLAALGLLTIAGLDASTEMAAEPVVADPPAFSPGHVVVIIGAMLVGPARVAVAAMQHRNVAPTTAIGAALVALVLAAYTANLLWDRATKEHRAQHDELTGLPNRALLFDRLGRALAHSVRSRETVAVMFIDLDRFKSVNDTFGHRAGDHLLQEVSKRLQGSIRNEDTVARLAGDEFAVLLANVAGLDGVVTVAERIKALFSKPVEVAGTRVAVTASIGVALSPHDGDTPEALLSSADAAMYRAKESGRNTFEIFSVELASRAHERLIVEAALLKSIEEGELVLHYQPSIEIATGRIVGAEALVRWQHPELGLIPPGEFIPVAEQSDLIVEVGNWVLEAAAEQAAAWSRADLPPMSIAVNVSARQLRHRIADRVASVLRQGRLDPAWLTLELTESAAVDDVDRLASTLQEVRDMGVRWAVDDFGTGYCTLTYLSRLPVDVLKVDKSFVQSSERADAMIVNAIIAMGHSLGMTVVAEGIETPAQLAALLRQGCDRAQGYLFSPAVPADEFEEMIRRQLAEGPPVPARLRIVGRPA